MNRKTTCAKKDPKRVEAVLHAGGGVMSPMEATCSGCGEPWDPSHMMVIYDDEKFTNSELRLIHFALACQIPGANPGPAQLSMEMEKAVLELAGKVQGMIR